MMTQTTRTVISVTGSLSIRLMELLPPGLVVLRHKSYIGCESSPPTNARVGVWDLIGPSSSSPRSFLSFGLQSFRTIIIISKNIGWCICWMQNQQIVVFVDRPKDSIFNKKLQYTVLYLNKQTNKKGPYTMRLSLELLNVLVLCVSLTILLKDRVDQSKGIFVDNTVVATTSTTTTGITTRNLQQKGSNMEETNTDFSFFLGDWYDCMHTSLTTFVGETLEKDIVETTDTSNSCNETNTNRGNITTIRSGNDQALKFDIYMLNRCSFHGFGGAGQRPCPNDSLGSNGRRRKGKILVKYSFKGVGSFAESDRIKFFADQSYIRNIDGEWKGNFERSKIENVDSMVCKKHMDGIVCDWHISEYRTAAIEEDSGCQKNGECKPGLGRQKCKLAGGNWTEDCPRTKYVSDGFLYDTFGSYYLVKEATQCNHQCHQQQQQQQQQQDTAEILQSRDAKDEEDETGERF